MGRHDHDDDDSNIMVVGSSIALLQERFRQLERVREKREAREKMAAPTCKSKTGFERKSSSSFSSTLSLGMLNDSPRRQRKAESVAYDRELKREEDVKRRQRLTNWWPDYDASTMANFWTPSSDQISEVDTSLHL